LARELGLSYLDTGAMYRALALKAKQSGLGPEDGDAAARLGKATKIEFGAGDPPRVMLDGEDVSAAIRTLEMGELASALSAFPSVRALLVAQQQAMVREGGFTLEGRDVTTIVAPDADVKVYLTASLEERAKRRHVEIAEKGLDGDYGKVRKEMQVRDHRDITREDSPLTVAPGATVIESGGLSPEQVVERIKALIPRGKD
jgi:CMP/dCMP kinase